ncbi:MAG: hypothetical protein CMF49_05350 [Legionellales bacterium]|nr:hypothetical protein [Legionellales bacterium]|tara:strand:- start:56 stop:943 length:888 start_codon:yes stop_codon:yes gene_type:complete
MKLKKFLSTLFGVLFTGLLLLTSKATFAATYALPNNGDNVVGQAQVIKVKANDNLHKIARRYDVGYDELVLANPLINPDKIYIGQEIYIPSIYIIPTPLKVPSITINIAEKRLYYYVDNNTVFTAPIAVGRTGWETPVAKTFVTRKVEQPYWRVPKVIQAYNQKQGKSTPDLIPPGKNNPLGLYAITLNLPDYILHGTNDPTTIGKNISAGCVRMYPEDIQQLFAIISIGTLVNIVNKPYKVGRLNKHFYIEVASTKNAEKILQNILQDNPNLIIKNTNILTIIQQGKGIPQQVS